MATDLLLTLLYRGDGEVFALSLTQEDVTVVRFANGAGRVVSRQPIPVAVHRFATSPRREVDLALFPVRGEQMAMLFDPLSRFGYAINLTSPERSDWRDLPDLFPGEDAPPVTIVELAVDPEDDIGLPGEWAGEGA